MKVEKVMAAVCSNKGRVRSNNEDNFCLNGQIMALNKMDAGGTFESTADGAQIYAVCDGMGGGDAGEEASFVAVDLLAQAIKRGEVPRTGEGITYIMQRASDEISQKHPGCITGSTVAMLVVDHGQIIAYNIGDSRIYRLRTSRLKQISEDHVGYQKHSITQYLGMPEEDRLEPAVGEDNTGEWTPLDKGVAARYLLCSDGLTDMVSDLEIRNVLMYALTPKIAAEKLVELALAHGGRDNVTAMVVDIPQKPREASAVEKRRRMLTALQIFFGCGLLAMLIEFFSRVL